MVWVGKYLKAYLILPLCHRQGHLLLGQIVSSPVQSGLEYFQGWSGHSFNLCQGIIYNDRIRVNKTGRTSFEV